ncbi:PssD/Cps14F family polysaccharide biosynthesis glycosyltransferase [Pseudalkalibacillus hwajinpoensis]|uniref:Beta-1,4-galactosyltransferase enhancer n=1 Tax=Guptibacillus hwajinpoensis TaxID=208199 RepID=A0A4U1MJ32_9BACL|nr:PssD/Cps14F family polysaccharide biosynthesis glycosyltransferase [Pseudalkalibacillus hwajinpoensis]TKD70731.1 beta-1,4-galactosyltransferase enhancer [Pseudalkalibacillus hwajinpoensis]
MKKKFNKVCLISSSGGHYEQLKMLSPLAENNDVFWITEGAKYTSDADYYLFQTGMRDKLFPLKMLLNIFKSIKIWYKERPDYVITTGTMIVLPMAFLAKLFGKKLIYIETFARVNDGTRAGRLMYKHADLFIIQWEPLKKVYPKAIYGGGIY